MSINGTARLEALRSNFELACLFGVIIVVADFIWLCKDISHNGFTLVYGLIGLLMIIGCIGTVFVIVRHNMVTQRILRKERLVLELKLKKRCAKNKQRKSCKLVDKP